MTEFCSQVQLNRELKAILESMRPYLKKSKIKRAQTKHGKKLSNQVTGNVVLTKPS